MKVGCTLTFMERHRLSIWVTRSMCVLCTQRCNPHLDFGSGSHFELGLQYCCLILVTRTVLYCSLLVLPPEPLARLPSGSARTHTFVTHSKKGQWYSISNLDLLLATAPMKLYHLERTFNAIIYFKCFVLTLLKLSSDIISFVKEYFVQV